MDKSHPVCILVCLCLFITGLKSQIARCINLPNSASLVVTTTVNTPLSFINCFNAADTKLLAENYFCGVAQVVSSNTGDASMIGGLFTTTREANTLLINTVGDWRVVYNAASTFNLRSAVGTTFRVTIGCTSSTTGSTTPITQDLLVYLTPNLQPTVFDFPGVDRTFDAKSTPANVPVYSLTVNDPENDFITYTVNTEPPVNYFNIDTSNGQIKTTVDLRTATEPVIFIRINVSDSHNVVGPFTVTVRLNNLNTRPDIVGLPTTVFIREDAVGGLVVSSLTVNDPDIFTTGTSLTPTCSVSPAAEQNKFVMMGNVIRLTSFNPEQDIFDYESISMYTINCTVNDGFLSSINEVITVNISNVNEPPVFNQRVYFCQLTESGAGASSCDLGLSIRDPEGNFFTTGFLPGNDSNRFALQDNDNSRLTFNIDYDLDDAQLPPNVIISLSAVDSIGATGTAKVSINVADANDNSPIFCEVLQAITVDYSTRLGIVGSIMATDKDQGSNGQIDYKMIGINPPNYIAFTFALGNGEIQYARNYGDNIAGSSAYITIRATDRGSPRRSSTGTIAVSFLATTTTVLTTTTIRTTTIPTTTTTTQVPTTTTEYNFFAHPENVTLLTFFILAIIIAAAIAMFLCARLSTLGYCINPNSGNTDVKDDYAYDSREGSPNYDEYRGKSGYFDREFSRGGNGRAPARELGANGRPLPAIRY